MDNFIFSLNATVPVFLVMVAGYVLKLRGKVNDNFCTVANDINYKLTLPALLFMDISTSNIREVFDLKYVAYCGIVTTVCFGAIWAGAKLLVRDKTEVGAFVQGSFRGSAAVLGVAFIQNMYGNAGMAPLMIIGAVPLYNIFSVIVLTFEGNNSDGKNIKNAFINICKNPIILSILAGVAVSLLNIDFPDIVDKTLESIARLATPLALLVIGAGFEGRKAIAKVKITVIGSVIKLIVQPAIFLPVAAWLGFSGDKMIAALIMLGAPTTASCYIMAKAMNNDEVLTSSLVVFTTLLSSVTLTGWIFVLKSMGLL
ncbi:MAG: AEC family transporter [Lachnospiraceae bacterium]